MGLKALAALALSACLPAFLLAQAPGSVVTGTVRDSGRTPLGDARIIARDLESGFTYTARSSLAGRYWLPGLPPGRYALTATQVGYQPVRHASAVLAVGQTLTIDFVLERSAFQLEPIEVVANENRVATGESGIATVFDREALARLPEESRQFTDLARLAPGATSAVETGEPIAGVSVGALSAYSVGIVVDGGNLMGQAINEQSGRIPLLAVQEFGVVTTSYAAEFGQAASGVINVATRRGTNRFAVEGFGLYRHRALNTQGAFEAAKPAYNRTHWGVAAGGPLVRDRTHFFLAVERRVENAFVTVATGGAFPSAEGTFRTPFTDNLLFARVDHRAGQTHQLTLRYTGELFNQVADVGQSPFCAAVGGGGPGAYEQGVTRDHRMHSVLLLDRWSVGTATTNEARLHLITYTEDREPLGVGGARIYPSLCAGSNLVQARLGNVRAEFKDDLSTTLSGATGTHRLKVGGLASWLAPATRVVTFAPAAFIFATDSSSLPALAFVGLGANRLNVRSLQLGAYLQDDWSPVSNLMLNLGLRYDLETNGTNQGFVSPLAGSLPFVTAERRPIDADNLAPRVGFAWDPAGTGRTVVRGGFGIFYDQALSYLIALERSTARLALVADPGTTDASQIPIDTALVPAAPTVLGRRMHTPFTRQFSLGVEQALGEFVVRVDGLLVYGRNLPITRELNTLDASGMRRFPAYQSVLQSLNRGEALGKLLLLRATRQFARSWIDVAYTLASRQTTTDVWFQRVPQVDPDDEDFAGELGPAAWDERHRIVGLAGSHLPLGFDGTVKIVYSSGRPYNAVTGTDDNGDTILNDRILGEGRNARRGPDFFAVDLSLARTLRVGAADLRLRANVYNMLNRKNLSSGAVVGNLRSPLFGNSQAALSGRQVELGAEAGY